MSTIREEARQTASAYDRIASVYDLLFGPFFRPGRRRAVERLDCRAGDRVLELGVGTGTSGDLYPDGVEVVGVDLSSRMLTKAKERIDARGLEGWSLVRMDAGRLGFPADSFDKVVAFYVISVLPDPQLAVEEMLRVCRPGGDLIILNHFHSRNPLLRGLERLFDPVTRRLGWKTTLALDELLEGNVLGQVEVEPVNLFGYWQLVHARKEGAHGEAAGIA